MHSEELKIIANFKSKYNHLIKEVNELQRSKVESKETHYSQMKTMSDLGDFFKECVQAGRRQIFKKQEQTRSKESIALLSELTRKSNEDLRPLKNMKSSSNRHTKTLIYDIVKGIVAVNKEQTKDEYLSHLKMDWETFQSIEALDVLALLLLKRPVFDKVLSLIHISEPTRPY
eukprot:TRINITY_DN3597_c0_g6_i1.p3 TRINITY_DN3597_c0_g6~~TRINITY_DN3597_c0_g6_i1.p3  ORF type:complete len:173 (-),score=67.55 TRINITY_DN3597_c0_g6_i1:48-566(-)